MPALSLRILVLDADPQRRIEATDILTRMGCREVFVAANCGQALAVVEQVGAIDIALCDMRDEGKDSLRFLQVAGASGLLRSIIITCSLSDEVKAILTQLSNILGVAYLGEINKPFNYDLLAETVISYWEHLHSDSPAVPTDGVFASEDDVRNAIASKQIISYFQPKFNLATGQVLGVEVLARWKHPERGVLSPHFFLPTVRRCGLLNTLLFLQLQQGLSMQQQALNRGYPISISFNLEAAQLTSSGFIERVTQALAAYELPGEKVIFELTENGILEDHVSCVERLKQLSAMGCGISIDDFGSGFSSLHRLCELPFTEIKLDSEFVREMNNGSKSRAIIRGTVALGEALSIPVIVEGIETEEQRQSLVAMGVRLGQGYLCARPMDCQSLLAWLDNHQAPGHPRKTRMNAKQEGVL
ncbi:EAL domain-containing protein [Pseudomonas chlororaphis]|uniref:Uncharacterized protein n=1 Tax=Pseudomonas chlororaphis TaxID=587753 RepID=A0A1Q8ESM9_9PSED|nr:EAL domain-containing response regulator [Pseudomonas chlororaphis]OLF54802.1 hypothetical protein BTN82_07280 [Pseudomonas chlororaphis]